jgi:ketosteroid isomerase-like protein
MELGMTSRTLIPCLLLVATAASVGACNSRSSQQPAVDTNSATPIASESNTEQTLTAMENAWPKAVAKRDTAMFERTLAPEFVYTEDSAFISRKDLISGMVAGPDTVMSGNNEDMKVHDFGNTAVVTGILVLNGRGKDGPFNRRYRFTDTWMKRDGKWQLVAAQDYLIPR